jgi:UDP-N-acetylmuramoylalanine--D-glutamate ligase
MSDLQNMNAVTLPSGRLADIARGGQVSVLGFGISNRPLVDILLRLGAIVTVYDQKSSDELGQEAREAEAKGARFTTNLEDALSNHPDLIFRTPGIRPDHPAILAAAEQGAELSSEMAWFLEITPATVLAITGSDGKTTTSTLTALMLEAAGKTVYLGGNIGRPLLPLATSMTKDDFAVVELSSFQLFDLPAHAVPHRAALTNLTLNHLNWHVDMEEYTLAKTKIYSGPRCSRLVTNEDNAITRSLAGQMQGEREVLLFSSALPFDKAATDRIRLKDGCITLCQKDSNICLLNTDDILLPGQHNVENYMTAIGLVYDLVPASAIRDVATSFGGVEHRLEVVRVRRGVTYYNSSIDSTPTRTAAALSALTCPMVVICGGYDKHIDFAPLADALCEKARAVVLTGATANQIHAAILACPAFEGSRLIVVHEPDFTSAVRAAANLALPGDAVLLSPACASFDAFPNFEVRGQTFKRIVADLNE